MIQFGLECHVQEKNTDVMHDCSRNKCVVFNGLISILIIGIQIVSGDMKCAIESVHGLLLYYISYVCKCSICSIACKFDLILCIFKHIVNKIY